MVTMGGSIRVVVAEDDPALREAIADFLRSEPDLELVGVAADADGAIEIAEKEQPDVVLVDVKMPGGGGSRAAREIRRRSPSTRVLALSAYEDRRTVLEMLRAGAVGYLVKGTEADEIVETIRRSMRGQGSLSVEVTAEVIHELTTLLDRSEAQAQELATLNRTKSELVQVLSHELLTPLTVLQGFAATVAAGWDRVHLSEVESMVDSVTRAGERVRRLVGNLAAAARLDREGLEVTTRPEPVADLLAAASAEFGTDHRRLRLPDRATLNGARVWADLDLAVRALVLLLENALAFSEDAAPVDVTVTPREAEVEIAVADRGSGVPEADAERIFEPLTQVDQSTTREHGGLGIGLFIARRIMSAHGGAIRLARRPGGGSVFCLSFPAVADPSERS